MSHFTVLVVGETPEKQLEPFDEDIKVEKYSRGEVSEEDKSLFLSVYTNFVKGREYGPKTPEIAELNSKLSFDELYLKYGDDWNSNTWGKNDDDVWCEYSTYSPKSKWDWYQLGGRWTGFLKLKDGTEGNIGEPGLMTHSPKDGYADSALKKDVDFDGMFKDEEEKAREEYKRILNLFDNSIPKIEHLWETIIDENNPYFNKMLIEEKRDFYHSQAAIKKAKEVKDVWLDIEDFQCTMDEYVEKRKKSAISTFAVLKDGEWYEKGKMGWWAIVSNEKSDWDDEYKKLLDEIPDDTLLSIYDCHI